MKEPHGLLLSYRLFTSSRLSPVAFEMVSTSTPNDLRFFALRMLASLMPLAKPSASPSFRPFSSPFFTPFFRPSFKPFRSADPSTLLKSQKTFRLSSYSARSTLENCAISDSLKSFRLTLKRGASSLTVQCGLSPI